MDEALKKKIAIAVFVLLFFGSVALCVSFFSTHSIAVLSPKGMIAMKQRDLFVTACWLMLIVVIPVFILTLAFAWKYRARNSKAKYTPEVDHNHVAECFWWGVPCIIIAILGVITWKSSHELSPYKPIETGKKPLEIQVVALQWKWLFIYPEQGIASVNFVQFPEQTPLKFSITADAPMNSFWIPELGGQIYAMPAMKTQLHLIANEVGDFRGSSANLSGDGFAGMTFTARASSQEAFDAWVQSARQSPKQLSGEAYAQLASPSENNAAAVYLLTQGDLFDRIVMKYMEPDVR